MGRGAELKKNKVDMRTNIHKGKVEQPIFPTKVKKAETKIVSLTVHKEKLTAQLDDGRELSVPIDWFAKWGIENVSASKLKKYEIWRGNEIYFPDIDEVLGIEKFIGGFNASCQ